MQELLRRISFRVRPLLPVLLLAGSLLACEAEESCVSQATNRLVPGFYLLNEKGEAVTGAYNFEEVRVLGSDSIFYRSSLGTIGKDQKIIYPGLAGLNLALNPQADSTIFVFEYDTRSDTLAVRYQRTFRMISPDCGLEIKFSDLEVFRHTFDSVQVINKELQEIATSFDIAIYSDNACKTLSTTELDAGFYRLAENGSAVATKAAFDEISAAETDSLFTIGTGGGLTLLLNPLGNSTTFLFENTRANLFDTLQLTYTRTGSILSPECGLDIRFSELKVSKSTFDSVSILNTELKSTEGLDVQIFE